MATKWYAEGMLFAMESMIAAMTAPKLMLVDDGYTYAAGHTVSDAATHRVNGTTDQAVTLVAEDDAANSRTEVDVTTGGGSVTFATVEAGHNIKYLVLYDDAVTDTAIAAFERSPVLATNGLDVNITLSQTDGTLQVSYA